MEHHNPNIMQDAFSANTSAGSRSSSISQAPAYPPPAMVHGGVSGTSTPSGAMTPGGRNRLTAANIDEVSRYNAMVKYMYSKISSNQWLAKLELGQPYGVALRRSRGTYVTSPEEMDRGLLTAIAKLNVEVAFTMATETTHVIFSTITEDDTDIMLPDGSQLQIVDSLEDIASSGVGLIKKFQYGALIRDEEMLLVWHDDLDQIFSHASKIEEKLLALIWGTSKSPFALMHTPGGDSEATTRQNSPAPSVYGFPAMSESKAQLGVDVQSVDEEDGKSPGESLARPLIFNSAISTGLGAGMIIVLVVGLGTSQLVFESLTDGKWLRLVLVVTEPLFIVFAVFFGIVMFGDIFQAIGPIGSLTINSRFYSSVKPDLSKAYSTGFRPPKITIQMPVYKESLEATIQPTIKSLKAAISYYESRGGSASIFINDDGLSLISEEEVQARVDFYHDNNIGWVARPKHNSEDGYVRKGKFKKASNMNFALNTSCKVEEILQHSVQQRLGHEKGQPGWIDAQEEEALYQEALDQVMLQDPRVKARGNIRVGEFILIVDSDTRVPEDCLLYGAAEMFLSPEVAIIQHSTGVMQVSWDYFENGITFFTNLVYSAIRFAVGSGEVAPFVGHNAFLRWQAVQSVGRQEENNYIAYWSESHVSEDFDIAMRLQIAGNVVRLATYHDNEFKEGVSLTIYDEIARWEKYAFGCNELVFNPMLTWLWRGPFTPLFRTFLWCDIQLSSKLTIIGYISSYYALASSFPLTIMNYILVGWFNDSLDKFYMKSWDIFLSVIVVFNLIGNLSLALLRYRLGEKGLWPALLENFKWMAMFSIFFGGLPFHLNGAILAHMWGIDMQWGATSKEVENSNFFKEVPKIFKSFMWMYLVLVPCIGGMIYLGCFAPRGWEIVEYSAVIPMAVGIVSHALVPFVLNPSIMVFNY